jgi:hypothetical protein
MLKSTFNGKHISIEIRRPIPSSKEKKEKNLFFSFFFFPYFVQFDHAVFTVCQVQPVHSYDSYFTTPTLVYT